MPFVPHILCTKHKPNPNIIRNKQKNKLMVYSTLEHKSNKINSTILTFGRLRLPKVDYVVPQYVALVDARAEPETHIRKWFLFINGRQTCTDKKCRDNRIVLNMFPRWSVHILANILTGNFTPSSRKVASVWFCEFCE